MYKMINNPITQEIFSVLRILDNATIPFDPANTDYQAYLKWLEDPNNKPLPADE